MENIFHILLAIGACAAIMAVPIIITLIVVRILENVQD
jgi:hypothetical protein